MFPKTPKQIISRFVLQGIALCNGLWILCLVYGATFVQYATLQHTVFIGPFSVNQLEKHAVSGGSYVFQIHFLPGFIYYEVISICVCFVIGSLIAFNTHKHN